MILTKKQGKVLYLLEKTDIAEILFGGGAGGGKSVLGCYWITKSALKYPETRWLIGRAKLNTLKLTTLKSLFNVFKILKLTQSDYVYNAQSNIITFFNGSEIVLKDLFLYPSDPDFDELGSLELTGMFIDEGNQIVEKVYEVLKVRLRYKLDEYNLKPKALITCNPSRNWVFKTFYKPFQDGTIEGYKTFVQALAKDNDFIDSSYKLQLARIKDPAVRRRLEEGDWNFEDSDDDLFQYEQLMAMFSNAFVSSGEKYCIVDVARHGKDKAVIGIWQGMRLIQTKIILKSDLAELQKEVMELCNIHSIPSFRRLYDDDGVGGGMVDFDPGSIGFVNNSSPKEVNGQKQNYQNLKTQCYYLLSEYVGDGKVFVEPEVATKTLEGKTIQEYLLEELYAVKKKNQDKDGKLQIIDKDEIKKSINRSPDLGDMMAMRMYFEISNTVPTITSG